MALHVLKRGIKWFRRSNFLGALTREPSLHSEPSLLRPLCPSGPDPVKHGSVPSPSHYVFRKTWTEPSGGPRAGTTTTTTGDVQSLISDTRQWTICVKGHSSIPFLIPDMPIDASKGLLLYSHRWTSIGNENSNSS